MALTKAGIIQIVTQERGQAVQTAAIKRIPGTAVSWYWASGCFGRRFWHPIQKMPVG
jgi:hypothetical protein